MTRADRLRHGTVAERIGALQEIAASPPATPEELARMIEGLGDEHKAVQRRAAEAFAQCARIDPLLVPRIGELLGQAPWRQRWGAVFALSLVGAVPPAALPTIIDALDSDDGDVRWAAAELMKQLAQHAPAIVTTALLECARSGGRNQRKMALYVLRDLQCQEGLGVALEGLDAAEIAVRLAALAALVALAPDKAHAAARIVALVYDEDERMRRAAAAALGELAVAHAPVLAALHWASNTNDPSLQRAADGALLKIRHSIP